MRPPPPRVAAVLPLLILLCAPHAAAFENLLHAQGEVRKDLRAAPLRFASPDWTVYHRTNHLHHQVAALSRNCPNARVTARIAVPADGLAAAAPPATHRLIDVDAGAGSDFDPARALPAAADGLLYVTVRALDAPAGASRARHFADGLLRRARRPRPTRVMFVFGEEGRDLLTSEIALRVLRDACGLAAPNSTRAEPRAAPLDAARPRLSPGAELVVVPVVNPDGRRIAEMGRRCDRTNARDVDVDRNWPSFWGVTDASGQSPRQPDGDARRVRTGLRAAVSRRFMARDDARDADRYVAPSGGMHPLSEPETRALRAIVEEMNPASYVSVRTGAMAVTVPWDCKPGLLADAQRAKLLRVTESITAGHCTRCKTGNLWNVTGRVKCGTGTDYMYGTLRVPFVHAWHVYDVPAPRGDCFRRHNPVSKAAYERVTQNWANAVFNFTAAVHNWMTLENSEGLNVAEQNASRSAAEASAQRAEALARGVPDPEADESEGTDSGINPAKSQALAADAASRPRGRLKDGPLFAWMFKDQNHTRAHHVGPDAPAHPGAQRQAGTADTKNEVSSGILTGWWGVWAAFLLLVAGFVIAKRYVFRGGSKRQRFRSRAPMKHA